MLRLMRCAGDAPRSLEMPAVRQKVHRLARLILFGLAAIGLIAPLSVQAQNGVTLRIAAPPIAGATAQSPLPDPITVSPVASDPAMAATSDLIENLYVGLFRYDSATRSPQPVLAKDWTTSADGLTWTFTLRDDIQWVGYNPNADTIATLRPVVAADVVVALQRACNPRKPSPGSTAIFVIRGCYAAAQSDPLFVTDARINGLVGAEAPDSTTLALHLAFPVAYLPALLTAPEFRPVPREFVDFTPAWPMIASSGPYVLKEWTLGEGLVLVRNPYWPDPLAGNITRVEIAYTDDPPGVLVGGEADFAHLDSQPIPGAVQTRGSRVTLLGFSTERAFVDNVHVRQALAWAIDRAALIGDDPALIPITTVTGPGAMAGPQDGGVGYEPEAARAALAAAGYPNCIGVPEVIRMAVPPGREALGQQIIAGWVQTFGCSPSLFEVLTVRADAITIIGRDLITEEYNTRIHMWLVDWTPESLDATSGAADAFHCTLGYFYSGIPCGPVDRLIDWAGATVMTPDTRADVYRRIEERLFGPAGTYPAIPLLADGRYLGVGTGLSGVGEYGPAWWGDWSKAG